MILAGDVGGTKTRLGIYGRQAGPRSPLASQTFVSVDYECLEALCARFLDEVDCSVKAAFFGVAGPVDGGRVQTTNLPWEITEERLADTLGLEHAVLFNDVVALAHAIPLLQTSELQTICQGRAAENGNIAIIAPGTGLGEAFATRGSAGYIAHASEGGHSDFAAQTEEQQSLRSYLRKRFDHVSYERVVSGPGLPNIYDYLRDSGVEPEPAWLADALAVAGDRAPIIVEAALDADKACSLCEKTLELFVEILGAEAGNLALTVLAAGGVYVGGGIPPKILPILRRDTFCKAFKNKGRMRPLLERIPVAVVLSPNASLLGAARKGLET